MGDSSIEDSYMRKRQQLIRILRYLAPTEPQNKPRRRDGIDIPLSKPKMKAPRHEKIAQMMLIHATVNRGFDSSILSTRLRCGSYDRSDKSGSKIHYPSALKPHKAPTSSKS